MLVSGLFAGIGGFELGLQRAGHRPRLLCENCDYASTVLRRRWPKARFHDDVADLAALPDDADIVTAGFPCQNLSMAGDKEGIKGSKSVIVDHLFRLLDVRAVPWVVIENVYFMLHLRKGAAISSILDRLERRNYRWAYRVVDSRSFGLAQRRRRVFIVASQVGDPRQVLLADEAPWERAAQVRLDRTGGVATAWLLLDGGAGWARPDGRRDSPAEGWIVFGDTVPARGSPADRARRNAANRGGGAVSRVPTGLDFGIAGTGRSAPLAPCGECRFGASGEVDRGAIGRPWGVRRRDGRSSGTRNALANRGLERRWPENDRIGLRVSGEEAIGQALRVRDGEVAGPLATRAWWFREEGQKGQTPLSTGLSGRPGGQPY